MLYFTLRRIVLLPSYDDLGFQATTRGGRVMDYILGNKAAFKATADAAGDIALAGSAIAHDESRRKERRSTCTRWRSTTACWVRSRRR